MNILEAPWNILAVLALFLLLLSVREFFHARRTPPTFPDRGVGFFHAALLFLFSGMIVALGLYWAARVSSAEEHIPLYPNARYAPEREHLFSASEEWIFVTADTSPAVVDFYRDVARALGYRFVENAHENTIRMLIARGDHTIFVTVVDEGRRRIIYYSEKGNARMVAAI